MTLGQKIKKYRKLNNLTQEQLGAKVGLAGDRIRQYEGDYRKPKEPKLREIAAALNIHPSTLLDYDIDSVDSVIHNLFELEDTYGLSFENVDGKIQLQISPERKTTDTDLLLARINEWITQKNSVASNDDSANQTEYTLWKARYPETKK